jgi:hypothetical protein
VSKIFFGDSSLWFMGADVSSSMTQLDPNLTYISVDLLDSCSTRSPWITINLFYLTDTQFYQIGEGLVKSTWLTINLLYRRSWTWLTWNTLILINLSDPQIFTWLAFSSIYLTDTQFNLLDWWLIYFTVKTVILSINLGLDQLELVSSWSTWLTLSLIYLTDIQFNLFERH